MIVWQQVTTSSRIIAEAFEPEASTIYVRFPNCVEWFFRECSQRDWEDFTAEGHSRGEFIARVLDFKPNGRHLGPVRVTRIERVGQLTGSTSLENPEWFRAEDPMKWPLLNDTGRMGVLGVDLGANTEFTDRFGRTRLYFFFGDVAIEQDPDRPFFNGAPSHMRESDLVAWTDDTQVWRHGGHLGMGLNFFLPNNEEGATPATGQPDWRFCLKCGALFFAPRGNTQGSVCPKGGEHAHFNVGKIFFLPNDEEGSSRPDGQKDWHFCGKCHGLCFAPGSAPVGACPKGDMHDPIGFQFSLPNQVNDPDLPLQKQTHGPRPSSGQPDWRFCIYCKGLFWSGGPFKGLCPGAVGGGFHLFAVVRNAGRFKNKFAPLKAEEPIGYTQTFETPSGAFSHDGRVYVFVGIAPGKFSGKDRGGDPAYGLYLVSNGDPASPGEMIPGREDDFTPTYHKEFLFSPRMGACPKDDSRVLLESHEILGHRFHLTSVPGSAEDIDHWRLCTKCESIFWNGSVAKPCFKGGGHRNEDNGPQFLFQPGPADGPSSQSHWRKCHKCGMLFFDGFAEKGRCPATGTHELDESQPALLLPFAPVPVGERINNGDWRFCVKCHGMVRANQRDAFSLAAACVVSNADHQLLPALQGRGVVLMTRNWQTPDTESAFRLAWMPLPASGPPRLQDVRYFIGNHDWSSDPLQAQALFPHPSNFFTSVSLTWLPEPAQWIVLYSENTPDSPPGKEGDKHRMGPVVARLSANLSDWSEPFRIFDPRCAHAYGIGKYMHHPDSGDTMHEDIPPLPVFEPHSTHRENRPGCAYGAFLLKRFTTWNATTRELEIHYLLSTGRPYQVHLMRTIVRLGLVRL